MHTLTIKLKQHTPLIHFQHDQEGATLRASEVKPRLDKFILTKLGKGDYQTGVRQALEKKWLVGKGDHPALDYKMRIEACDFQELVIPIKEVRKRGELQKDEIGRQLYATLNYPDNEASLIMSNIGGRPKDEVLNFSIATNIQVKIVIKDSSLENFIKRRIVSFFDRVSFGNRTSKGFGSFEVLNIDGETIEPAYCSDNPILIFKLDLENHIDRNQIYKDTFKVIHYLWKALKRRAGVRGKADKNVLLNIRTININGVDRIPSPIVFKPLIDISEGGEYCDVAIASIFDLDVIKQVTGSTDTSYYKELISSCLNDIENSNFSELKRKVNSKISRGSLQIRTL